MSFRRTTLPGDLYPANMGSRRCRVPGALWPANLVAGGGGPYSPLTTSLDLNNDTVNEYVSYGVFAASNFGKNDPFSLGVWLKPTAGSYVITKRDYPNAGYQLVVADATVTTWLLQSGSDYFKAAKTLTGINDGGWHLLMTTYAGGNHVSGISILVDGVDVGISSITGSTLTGDSVNTAPLYIGAQYGWAGQMLVSKLCHSFIYNVELTEPQALEMYGAGVPQNLLALSTAANLVHWSTIGDGCAIGAGNMLDISGNGNHGTTTNVEAGDFVADVPT